MNAQDSNHSVPLHVVERTLLQEDISLVNEHDGIPAGRNIEYLFQGTVQT